MIGSNNPVTIYGYFLGLEKMSGFYPDTFEFLKTLSANNNKAWFDEHRENYEHHVRGPAIDFVEAFSHNLSRLSPHFIASAKKVGGSMMRIHRDTRFSKDKTPYKTHVGIHFRHQAGKDIHSAAYYLHISEEECFIGAGIWRPDSKAISGIRDRIDQKPELWKKVIKSIKEPWAFTGESLVRPPRGFDKDHPLIDDLKRKDFILLQPIDKQQVLSPDLPDYIYKQLKSCSKLMEFLCQSVDQPF